MVEFQIPSPLGALTLTEHDNALVSVAWGPCATPQPTALLDEAAAQFAAYFDGRLQCFDLPWRVEKSAAQARACAAMAAIPFGETRTYGDLAKDLGVSAQSMGQLAGGNPMPILVPCHRVMGAGGKLTGFSGGRGVEDKVWLLRHESAAGLLI